MTKSFFAALDLMPMHKKGILAMAKWQNLPGSMANLLDLMPMVMASL